MSKCYKSCCKRLGHNIKYIMYENMFSYPVPNCSSRRSFACSLQRLCLSKLRPVASSETYTVLLIAECGCRLTSSESSADGCARGLWHGPYSSSAACSGSRPLHIRLAINESIEGEILAEFLGRSPRKIWPCDARSIWPNGVLWWTQRSCALRVRV